MGARKKFKAASSPARGYRGPRAKRKTKEELRNGSSNNVHPGSGCIQLRHPLATGQMTLREIQMLPPAFTWDDVEVMWNGHDWVGVGGKWMNQCKKEFGWTVLTKEELIITQAPSEIKMEVITRRGVTTIPAKGVYARPGQRFRILGLKPGASMQVKIYHEVDRGRII